MEVQGKFTHGYTSPSEFSTSFRLACLITLPLMASVEAGFQLPASSSSSSWSLNKRA